MKKLILFGASNVGIDACNNLKIWNKNEYDEILFCDNDEKKRNTTLIDQRIINFQDLQSLFHDSEDSLDLFITSSYTEEIVHQCIRANLPISGVYMRKKTQAISYESIWNKPSFSQCAEDSLLEYLFYNYDGEGFYVDIGAYHPYKYSNTFWAYQKGWCGINIEPNPENFELFNLLRTRDINLNFGIAAKEGFLDYYMYEEGAYNTFNPSLRENQFIPKQVKKVEVKTLEHILDTYCPNKQIDFMNIDVETLEIEVLQSNNWNKYRPSYIFVEQLKIDIEDLINDQIYKFMRDQGYRVHSKLMHTILYERQD